MPAHDFNLARVQRVQRVEGFAESNVTATTNTERCFQLGPTTMKDAKARHIDGRRDVRGAVELVARAAFAFGDPSVVHVIVATSRGGVALHRFLQPLRAPLVTLAICKVECRRSIVARQEWVCVSNLEQDH
jgi:hypothetical protein